MGYSRIMADKILLDLKGLILSLMFAKEAFRREDSETEQFILQKVKDGLQEINEETHLLGSFEAIYHSDVTPKSIEEIVNLLEEGEIEEATKKLNRLNTKLSGEFNEKFSATSSYGQIRSFDIPTI